MRRRARSPGHAASPAPAGPAPCSRRGRSPVGSSPPRHLCLWRGVQGLRLAGRPEAGSGSYPGDLGLAGVKEAILRLVPRARPSRPPAGRPVRRRGRRPAHQLASGGLHPALAPAAPRAARHHPLQKAAGSVAFTPCMLGTGGAVGVRSRETLWTGEGGGAARGAVRLVAGSRGAGAALRGKTQKVPHTPPPIARPPPPRPVTTFPAVNWTAAGKTGWALQESKTEDASIRSTTTGVLAIRLPRNHTTTGFAINATSTASGGCTLNGCGAGPAAQARRRTGHRHGWYPAHVRLHLRRRHRGDGLDADQRPRRLQRRDACGRSGPDGRADSYAARPRPAPPPRGGRPAPPPPRRRNSAPQRTALAGAPGGRGRAAWRGAGARQMTRGSRREAPRAAAPGLAAATRSSPHYSIITKGAFWRPGAPLRRAPRLTPAPRPRASARGPRQGARPVVLELRACDKTRGARPPRPPRPDHAVDMTAPRARPPWAAPAGRGNMLAALALLLLAAACAPAGVAQDIVPADAPARLGAARAAWLRQRAATLNATAAPSGRRLAAAGRGLKATAAAPCAFQTAADLCESTPGAPPPQRRAQRPAAPGLPGRQQPNAAAWPAPPPLHPPALPPSPPPRPTPARPQPRTTSSQCSSVPPPRPPSPRPTPRTRATPSPRACSSSVTRRATTTCRASSAATPSC
jgi:hypothetical protein